MNFPKSDDEFVFHATDKRGHHTTMRFALPVDMAQTISQIVEKGYFPYRTKEDVIRDALYHRLRWLEENKSIQLGGMLQRIRGISEILNQELFASQFQEHISNLDAALGKLAGDEEAQSRLVNTIMEQVLEMPAGHWKRKYTSYLKQHYGEFLKPWSMERRS